LVEDAEGQVIGPVGSANAALTLLQTCVVAAAIPDVQLTDGDATPIADALAARGVPKVFHCAVNLPSHLQLRYPNAIFYQKPVSAERLLNSGSKAGKKNAKIFWNVVLDVWTYRVIGEQSRVKLSKRESKTRIWCQSIGS
jgi:hypothetical protein